MVLWSGKKFGFYNLLNIQIKMKIEEQNQIVDFLYEIGMLQKTPRSGFQFLGSGGQSVAEHLHRASVIAFILGLIEKVDNPYKVATMAMLHDVSEARISDLNYVHQKYNTRLEDKAHTDIVSSLPPYIGVEIKNIIDEYENRETLESKLVKDADNLEWIMSLKEQADIGNGKALEWLPSAIARLKTDSGKTLGEIIQSIRSDRWWFGDPKDSWWIDRQKSV